MRKNYEDRKGKGSPHAVALIFSAVWGLSNASTAGKNLAPQEMVSLYALYVSLGAR
jgi:hypothetical protein